jgi:hypothetical protein
MIKKFSSDSQEMVMDWQSFAHTLEEIRAFFPFLADHAKVFCPA